MAELHSTAEAVEETAAVLEPSVADLEPPAAVEATSTPDPIKSESLVIDANFIIKLHDVRTFGYEEVYTTQAVLDEIRDAVARKHLSFPSLVELKVAVPTEADVRFVRRFAAETGDLGSLSSTDLELVALTYMLQRQTGEIRCLRTKPQLGLSELKIEIVNPPSTARKAAGEGGSRDTFRWTVISETPSSRLGEALPTSAGQALEDEKRASDIVQPSSEIVDDGGDALEAPDDAAPESPENAAESSDDAAEPSDEEGWITKDNLEHYKAEQCQGVAATGEAGEKSRSSSGRVACVTTDYAMQNLMLHMGLHVLSTNGMRVNRLSRWVKRCTACRWVTVDSERRFCGSCGNLTLRKVPVMVAADGTVTLKVPARHAPRVMGRNCNIPFPRGGHKGNLILCEDHYFLHGRERLMRRAATRQKANNLDNYFEEAGVAHLGRPKKAFEPTTTLTPGIPAKVGGNASRKRL